MCLGAVLRAVCGVHSYNNAEMLMGDNQWFCDRCGCKVTTSAGSSGGAPADCLHAVCCLCLPLSQCDATKGVKLRNLPPIMTLHLKRYVYSTPNRLPVATPPNLTSARPSFLRPGSRLTLTPCAALS